MIVDIMNSGIVIDWYILIHNYDEYIKFYSVNQMINE